MENNDAAKQPGEPEGLRQRFNRDLQTAVKYMTPLHQRMDRDYEWYRNDRNDQDTDEPMTVSQLYEYVETVTPIVTNNRIRANVYSEYPDYVTHAKGMNAILDHTYDANNWDYMSQELMREALIQRSSLAYTGFDDKYKNKTGKLCIERINLRWSYLDPSALCLEDSGFFIYVEPKRKGEVKAMNPKRKTEIDNSVNSNLPNEGDGGFNKWFKSWLYAFKQRVQFLNNNTKERLDVVGTSPELDEGQRFANSVAYIHYWYRDDDDKWRVSYWADKVFLKDEPNPFWHECLPYDIFSPIKDIRSLLGIPMGEQIGGIDRQRNVVLDYAVANARLHGNPPLLHNTSFGNVKDPRKLKQEGDANTIPLNNPDMVDLRAIAQYMTPPQMDGNAIQMPERLEGLMDKITGVNDSFRGTQQATSGKEVQLQQEASYTRIKTMIDQFELFNKKIAEKILINAMQFYKQQRTFRVKGDYVQYESEGAPYQVQPIPKGVDAQGQPIMSRTEFFMYANPNEWTKLKPEEGVFDGESDDESGVRERTEEEGEEEVEEAYNILSFVVEIEAGSSLPQSRLARREEAIELAGAGMIDQESVLQAFDWPDRDEVVKRMSEKAVQAQQAQAEAAQMEAQSKVQAEQVKAQTQLQIEKMKLQGQAMQTHANNKAKMEQQQAKNRGEVAEQSMENTGNSLAETLDQIREENPEADNMSDEQLIQILQQ